MDQDKKNTVDNLQTKFKEILELETKLKESRDFKKVQKFYTDWINKFETLEQNAKDKNWDKIALAYNNRGHLKYLSVDFDGAVDDYNKALEYNAELSSCYYNRGTIFYRMGYFDKALKDMKKATELSTETEEFKIGLKQCEQELNKIQSTKLLHCD